MSRAAPLSSGYPGPIVDVHTHPRLPGFPEIRRKPHRLADYLRTVRGLDIRYAAVLVMAPRGDLERTRRMNDRAL